MPKGRKIRENLTAEELERLQQYGSLNFTSIRRVDRRGLPLDSLSSSTAQKAANPTCPSSGVGLQIGEPRVTSG
jgi:hypothetical protein